jgi:RND family efflux transporter MFP subunit
MIGLFLLGVGGWLFARVTSTVSAKQAIEVERANRPQVATDVADVELASYRKVRWQANVPLEGTIEARDRAELAFKVTGQLISVDVRLGDKVKAGQLLGRLDAGEASAQVRAAEAQLEAARAQLALATDQGQRAVKLVASGALDEASGVQATQGRALSLAQVNAAQAHLSLAQVNLANQALVAPFSGIVTRAPTTRGAVVTPGQALFEIVDNTLLRLRGTVNEADAGLFAVGAEVTVTTSSGPAHGKVRAVVAVLDRFTRRVPLEVDLEPHQGLRVGSFVRAFVTGDQEIDVFEVPGSALRPGSQDTLLIVNGDVLEERQVRFSVDPKTGALWVREGLVGNERIVLVPRPEAKNGDKVRVGAEKAGEPAPEPTRLETAKE